MKGRAHLEWLQLLQLNKCGWMIISVPRRNKSKRRQRQIITPSKTIKSDFEVAAPPNLSNTSAAEMAFWAQPTGAVGPLRHGVGPGSFLCFQPRCWVAEDTAVHSHPQSGGGGQESSHDPHPCIKTSWEVGALVLAHNLEPLLQPSHCLS